MRISAIVSTYNSARFLPSRLDNLLAQTESEIEIIVVNSGSLENEREIALDYARRFPNIVYLESEREPLYAAWNRAIEVASGKYLTNANTDDRLFHDSLKSMCDSLDANPDKALAYANLYFTDSEEDILTFEEQYKSHPSPEAARGKWLKATKSSYSHMALLMKCYIGPQPVWRRSAHSQYGLFDSEFIVAGDYEFWLRIAEHNGFVHVDQPLGLYFNNPAGIENSNRYLLAEELKRIRISYFSEKQPVVSGAPSVLSKTTHFAASGTDGELEA